jgi:hypothetical protein
MKRQAFIRELEQAGCQLHRHGKRHDIYRDPANAALDGFLLCHGFLLYDLTGGSGGRRGNPPGRGTADLSWSSAYPGQHRT